MKHRSRQFELSIPDEPFSLITDTAVDGDRITREAAQSAADKQTASLNQLNLQTEITPP